MAKKEEIQGAYQLTGGHTSFYEYIFDSFPYPYDDLFYFSGQNNLPFCVEYG